MRTLVLILVTLFASGCDKQQYLVEQRILQFGTIIDISIIHHNTQQAELALDEIERRLELYQNNWNAWGDSDLARFNRTLESKSHATVPDSLSELIRLSQDYYLKSNRLFNPALGKLIAAYGFHGSGQTDQKIVDMILQSLPNMSDLALENQLAISTNSNLQLDFGGIAKGYAIQLITDYLHQADYHNFLINAGGDIHVAGTKFSQPWTLGVQNPFAAGSIASISLEGDYNLFTSGNYQRYYEEKEKRVHHIIDPRTGAPSMHISSATVLASDAVRADVAATTLMIDGAQHHRELAQSLGITDYLIVTDDRQITISRSLADKITITSDWPVTTTD